MIGTKKMKAEQPQCLQFSQQESRAPWTLWMLPLQCLWQQYTWMQAYPISVSYLGIISSYAAYPGPGRPPQTQYVYILTGETAQLNCSTQPGRARTLITIRGIFHGVSLHSAETRREKGKEKRVTYIEYNIAGVFLKNNIVNLIANFP